MFMKKLANYTIYPKYWNSQAWADIVDRSDATECDIWSGSTLFATHSMIFKYINRSKQSSILCSLKLL